MPYHPYERSESQLYDVPSLFIAANERDEFGFQEGAEHIAKMAASHSIPVEWHLLPGGHCKLNIDDIAAYLTIS